ncbi:DUF6220 domain-containing protein [Aquamicrobium sp. LC103]|uniref:DUF6220 domain-containing protein n=1 Tax=Aquamicrobium sp. LC103 TaxID=1120658 RepID=UPI00063E7B36|nr:DUF6220 domain-containing protein [Aquamicrobium sp. LC103]TKT75326.1 hypothetical protein XW59_019540 [Aquamicrobium sp. LC103]
MEKKHDTLTDLHLGTPVWFTLLAWVLPIGIFAQFLSAGLGLFLDPNLLGLHGGSGIALSLPAILLPAGTLLVRRLRGFGWWTTIVLALYLVQVALAAGAAPVPLSLHPANGALLLAASLVLLAKVERRRSQTSAG